MNDKRTVSPAPETRELILSAALHEFSESGYAGARVDRIAAQAGVNKAMLYYHFGSKRELFVGVVERFYKQVIARHQQWINTDLPLPEKLTAAADVIGEILTDSPEFLPILLRALADRDEEVIARIGAILQSGGLPQAMIELFASHSLSENPSTDAIFSVMAFFSINLGFYVLMPLFETVWQETEYPFPPEQARQRIVDIFLHGVHNA